MLYQVVHTITSSFRMRAGALFRGLREKGVAVITRSHLGLKLGLLPYVCGNKMPTRCNRGFYCRSYCLLNMFRASLCPSSGAQEYYTVVAARGIWCCGFQVAGLVWS